MRVFDLGDSFLLPLAGGDRTAIIAGDHHNNNRQHHREDPRPDHNQGGDRPRFTLAFILFVALLKLELRKLPVGGQFQIRLGRLGRDQPRDLAGLRRGRRHGCWTARAADRCGRLMAGPG